MFLYGVAPGEGVGVIDGVEVDAGVAAEERDLDVGVEVTLGVGVGVGVGVDGNVSSSSNNESVSITCCDDFVDAPNDDAELTVGVTVAPLITIAMLGVGVGVG